MSDFKWDKEAFGENAEQVEKLIGEAINFSKKLTATEKEAEIAKLSTEIENLKKTSNTKLEGSVEVLLQTVPEKNRDLVKELVGSDISKFDEVKTKYKNLFEVEKQNIDIEKLIKEGFEAKDKPAVLDHETLKKKVESGKATPEEETQLWAELAALAKK